MRGVVTVVLSLIIVASLAIPLARGAFQQLQQSFPVVTARSNGQPPCDLGGNPDQQLCLSSDQDNVAPQSAPWVTAVRWNTSANWTINYEAWLSNETTIVSYGNVRAVTANLAYNSVLQRIVDDAESGGGAVTIEMSADTPYVTITLQHVGQPDSVTWRAQPLTFRYEAGVANGTLTITPTFTDGALVIGFPAGGGASQTMTPFLPGLTNFPQLGLIPNPAQIAAFSCDNVTLTDPRGIEEVSATRLWVFDWGDGTPQTRQKSPTASHLYGSPGIYNVTMTVQTETGTALAYSGRVDTTTLTCGFNTARQVMFVILTGATVLLIAFSFILPKRTKAEKKKMRRKALACAVAVVLLVVVL